MFFSLISFSHLFPFQLSQQSKPTSATATTQSKGQRFLSQFRISTSAERASERQNKKKEEKTWSGFSHSLKKKHLSLCGWRSQKNCPKTWHAEEKPQRGGGEGQKETSRTDNCRFLKIPSAVNQQKYTENEKRNPCMGEARREKDESFFFFFWSVYIPAEVSSLKDCSWDLEQGWVELNPHQDYVQTFSMSS